jgi:hypothetical protein
MEGYDIPETIGPLIGDTIDNVNSDDEDNHTKKPNNIKQNQTLFSTCSKQDHEPCCNQNHQPCTVNPLPPSGTILYQTKELMCEQHKMQNHVVMYTVCGCAVVQILPQKSFSDWTPRRFPFILTTSLGYIIGDAMHTISHGFNMMLFIATLLLGNELTYAFFRRFAKRENMCSPKTITGTFVRLLVLIRIFSVTAGTTSINLMLRRSFSGEGNVLSIVLPIVIIFVVVIIMDEFSP